MRYGEIGCVDVSDTAGKETLVALYQYDSRADGDLSFKKGDIMYLLDSRLLLNLFFVLLVWFF